MKVSVKRLGQKSNVSETPHVDFAKRVVSDEVSEKDAEIAMGTYYKCKSSLLYAENNGHMVLDGVRIPQDVVERKMNAQVPTIDKYFVQTGHPTLSQMQARVNQRCGIGLDDTIQSAAHKFETPGDESYKHLNRYTGGPMYKMAEGSKISIAEMLNVQMMYEGVLRESQKKIGDFSFSVIDEHSIKPHEMDKIMSKQLGFLEIGENQNGLAQMREPGSNKRQIAYMPGGRCSNPIDYELMGMQMQEVKATAMNRRLPSVVDDFGDNQHQSGYGDYGQ